MSFSNNLDAEGQPCHAKCFSKSLISLIQSTLRPGAAQSDAKLRKVQHSQGLRRTQSTSRKVHPYGGGDALRAPPCPSWSWGREKRQDVQMRPDTSVSRDTPSAHFHEQGERHA